MMARNGDSVKNIFLSTIRATHIGKRKALLGMPYVIRLPTSFSTTKIGTTYRIPMTMTTKTTTTTETTTTRTTRTRFSRERDREIESFTLIKEHLVEFNQLAMANAEGSDNMLNRVMPKDNIGLAALLRTKEAAWDNDGRLDEIETQIKAVLEPVGRYSTLVLVPPMKRQGTQENWTTWWPRGNEREFYALVEERERERREEKRREEKRRESEPRRSCPASRRFNNIRMEGIPLAFDVGMLVLVAQQQPIASHRPVPPGHAGSSRRSS
ncbi:CCR4-NOT transcription complex subunit 6-like [Vespula squamosa]|uniref:CCR4-NOT transcription complex subunit 6-like n=1 Tax=Vespula squamosa TaxID=30214 RepID=A0ABD2B855_VESSQ